MNAPDTRRISVVLNDRAGTASKSSIAERTAEHLAGGGRQVDIAIARSGAELLSAAARAAASDADVVVAGGGDGTIATIASALVGSNKLLGVLPLGTFNYFARRLNIPLELDGALEIVSTGRPTPVDVGELNGHLFLNNASIGFYAAQLQRREQIYGMLGRRQALAYLSGALALVQRPALFNLQIDLNGIRMSRRTPLLFVGNNDYQMDTFGIPGRECARGGHFATYITRPLPLLSLWGLAFRAIFRGLYGARGLEVICARELRVDLRRPRVRVALDGELKTLAPPLLFQRRIGGLVVLAPPESPR